MVITMECTMLDSCEKSFDSLSENSIVQRQDLLRLEMNNFWNELFMKEEKQELYSSWSPSDNCCSVGQYDTESTFNQADDFAFCIMGHHKILSPLLKDSFLTTPFLEARKRSEAFVENEEKGDDTKNRENLLEEMASADLTTYCVDPNEIFYNGQLKKLGSAAVESRNSLVVSDFSSVISSGNLSYEEMWSDSDSDELQSSSQPSEEEVDEIDVVSITRSKDIASRSPPGHQLSSYESRILPATPLMSERVAALHNYSTRPVPCPRAVAHKVTSAPHSPSDRVVPVATKRSVSTPSSPASRPNNRWKRRARGNADKQKGRSKRFKLDVDHNKRALHNKLEQTRRLMLMEQFHQLRDVIPTIKDNARVSKSDILTNGRLHIFKLQQLENDLDIAYKNEFKIRDKLEKALQGLRASSCRRPSAK